jgi:NADP-dependent 3-hydroxy acid dehydrogenase YdfG
MKISHQLLVVPKVALPYFIEQKSGKIINISSMNGGAYLQ